MLSSTGSSRTRNQKHYNNAEGFEREEFGQENTTDDKVRGYVGSYDASSSYSSTGRFRPRGRVTEFRHSRGVRGRGRGGYSADNSYKYHDSLGHSSSEGWTVGNKFYDKSDLVLNLPEDPRISKLLRRLWGESDIEKSLALCNKLQDAVLLPDNARYIQRAYDILVDSLLDVLCDAPGPEIKAGAAVVLGRIGYAMGPHFMQHLDWIISTYDNHNTSLKHLLTLSLTETFQLDLQSSLLNDYVPNVLERLQVIIESTNSADVFTAAINTMIILSNSYPENFANHFVDTVDILVGWHVDNTQPKIKQFALQSLYKLSRHWQADVEFSTSLLNHFVEDMVAYSNNLHSESNNDESASLDDNMQKVTSFINVFNTVVKSLGTALNPNMSQSVHWSFLTECMTKVLQVMTKVLKAEVDEDLILAGNECIGLLLGHLQSKTSACAVQLYSLISMELTGYLNGQDKVCLSIINLIARTIKEIASNLPIQFITQIIGIDSLIRPLRYSENKHVLEAVISVYSNLLNLKNIPLLQETYKYVLSDIQTAFSKLIADVFIIQTEYTEELPDNQAEKNIIFYLQCLSELANASNSIIGMWALQPSILDLLAVKMIPHNDILINDYPALHHAIVYLLYSHCKRNNHFIASSDLVTNSQQRANDIFGIPMGEVTGSSPTSGHLAVILNLLSVILEKYVYKETLLLILNWIFDILFQLDKYLPIVNMSKSFLVLLKNMIALGHTFDDDIVVLVMKNSKHLLQNKNVSWNVMILKNIATLCLLHIDSNSIIVNDMCLQVLFDLPWDIVQLEIDKQKITIFMSRKMTLDILNRDMKINSFKEYLMRGSFTTLSSQHFKSIMSRLLQSTVEDKNSLQNTFLSSWPLLSEEPEENNLLAFRQCAMTFSPTFIGWILSELAQSCVTLKLRTPLGKPQETFMKIEGALKGIARETSSLETKYCGTDHFSVWKLVETEQIRSRWITEFMVLLEKYIYNAAEGTAVVLPVIGKPVRTFFHTNWPTCREWLTRVRPAALAVSLYSGHFGAAVYHAQLILQTAANSNTNVDIEAIAMSITRSLIKLQEPEVLHGLYVWIKQKFDKKFLWLKAAAEQANSKYEVSVDYYKKLHGTMNSQEEKNDNDESCSSEHTKLIRFIDEQILECYKHVQSWEEMQGWLHTQQEDNSSQCQSFTALNAYEQSLDVTLSNWDIIDIRSKEISKNNCSSQGLLNKIEMTLINTALNIYYTDNNCDTYSTLLEQCESLLNVNMVEFSRNNAVHFMKELAILQLANCGLQDVIKKGKAVHNPFKPSCVKEHRFGTDLENLTRAMWWNQYFTKLNTTEENIFYAECLRLDVIKSARKNINLSMAKRELLKHFKNNTNFQVYLGNINCLEDLSDILILSTNTYDLDIWSVNNAAALVELCKLTYQVDDIKSRAINLCASVSLGFSQRLAMGEQSYELREKGTRMLLTLSKWVQAENESILINNLDSPLTKLVTALPEIGLVDNNISENVIPLSDSAVGKLLQFSVNQCPGLAKAWSSFAAWCFRWGRKMVEYSSKTGEQLTENDKMQIKSVMIGCSPQDFEAVCEILCKTKATCDDEDIDWNEINTSEMIESQLRTVPSLSNAFPDHLVLLVDIWKQAQKRVFSYFELSADAYFKFLQLICAADYINHNGEYAVVSATLRLLRLIVKHAMELQTVLEAGLANTPTQPWKVIIPQLFSRLNHPETYVRKCVSDLLCRLAEDTPHLITFPAVVGAVENEGNEITEFNAARSFLSNDTESVGQDLEYDDGNSEKGINNELNCCFLDMVETLTNQAPKTIQQVKLLVKELQRINLLWDELWLGTLVQHHSDFSKRLAQLETEVAKVKNNSNLTAEEKDHLIKEKHRIIFEPIVYVLEQLNELTKTKPETPHEVTFQNKFQSLINDVIDKLKHPTNPDKPQESWAPLKQLQIKFHQKINRRTSYILRMSDISPVLAELKDTVITMPGVHTNQRTVRVTIKSVDNNVAILPTKTRPKKLVFRGSDGKSYIYLFKGLEDLHLDERIMQLLSIVNTMMARDSENDINQTYRARHYSVIPLGPRSGLISWVDNVTPLFALYKRWQTREAAILSAKLNKTVNVLRPSELFNNKLNPLLQEAGISYENRKEWPISVLKQVLQELTAETPKDLLWRELSCGSVSPEQWWRTIRRYSYSVAVMSTIGYIIGLGDRHLDNVLVDLSSGEVVHIDYNVCFEKGKTLRVPEKVPFRMTPNLVTALGVTGVEGIFRLACEHVLRTMRRGRETLLTLLEAFVYDPLVEWGAGGGAGAGGAGAAVGGGGGGARRRRELRDVSAALAMLAVRAQELKQDLADNTEQFLQILPEIKEKADKWLEENDALKSVESKLQQCHQQMALIKEIEAYGNNLSEHPLYAISQKYSSYKQAKNAVEDSMKALVKILKDFDAQIESFAAANEAINGPQFLTWVKEFSNAKEDEDLPIFEHITEFLTNAGQASMITQCEQAETELKQSLRQTKGLINTCLELLSQYVAVSQYYPQSQTEYHRVVLFRKLIAAALESKSPEVCHEVSNQVTALVNADNNNANVSQQIMAYNCGLQNIVAEANLRLNKEYERLHVEAGHEAMVAVHAEYRDAKANLSKYLRTEEGSLKMLESVVVGMLCSLNKRYLTLENRAQSAGDCLVDLTSIEGEWFLDEMYMLSTEAVELLLLLPVPTSSEEDNALPVAIECVRSANSMLSDLVQLNYNFGTIILPEMLKKVHTEDPSTASMMNELNAVIMNTPIPLNELLAQLEMHLRYLVMDMESPVDGARAIAADLRARYETILSPTVPGEDGQSPGRMLLMGFNGLFAAVELRWRELADHLTTPVPAVWRKIDQINEAMRMSGVASNSAARGVLEDMMSVRRVQAVAELLALAASAAAAASSASPLAAPPDFAAFLKPVRRVTAEIVSRCLLGVPSRALAAAVCLMLRDTGLDLGLEIEQKEIGAAWSVPLEALCARAAGAGAGAGGGGAEGAGAGARRVLEGRARLESGAARQRALELAAAAQSSATTRRAAHSALHAAPDGRLAARARELFAALERLALAHERAQRLLAGVHQRLKWGVGANPALAPVLRALTAAWGAAHAAAARARAAGAAVAKGARAAAVREPQPRAARLCRQALAHWEKACSLARKYALDVSPVEESLMEMLHPEGNIDVQWVESVAGVVRETAQWTRGEAAAATARRAAAAGGVRAGAAALRCTRLGRRALLADSRACLLVLQRHPLTDNPAAAFLAEEARVRELLDAAALDEHDAHDAHDALDATHVRAAAAAAQELQAALPELQRLLLQIHIAWPTESTRKLTKQVAVTSTKACSKQGGAAAGTWRSAQGAGVWKRVRLKLEGRRPDAARAAVSDQVEYMISEATSADNLCTMYEGWMAWV